MIGLIPHHDEHGVKEDYDSDRDLGESSSGAKGMFTPIGDSLRNRRKKYAAFEEAGISWNPNKDAKIKHVWLESENLG